MPRRTLLIVGLMLAGGPSLALAQGLSVGVEAGVAQTQVDRSSVARTAPVAGAVLRYEFGPSGRFALQSGVSRVRKGWKQSPGDPAFYPPGYEGWGWRLDYLELPLLAAVRAHVSGPVRFRIVGGGTVSFETGCEFEERWDGTTVTYACGSAARSLLLDQPYKTRPIDIGLLLGVGVEVEVGPGSLTLDGRHGRGLTDISDLEPPADVLEAHHRFLSLTVGYLVRP